MWRTGMYVCIYNFNGAIIKEKREKMDRGHCGSEVRMVNGRTVAPAAVDTLLEAAL